MQACTLNISTRYIKLEISLLRGLNLLIDLSLNLEWL